MVGYEYAGQDPINGYDLTGTFCWKPSLKCARADAKGVAAVVAGAAARATAIRAAGKKLVESEVRTSQRISLTAAKYVPKISGVALGAIGNAASQVVSDIGSHYSIKQRMPRRNYREGDWFGLRVPATDGSHTVRYGAGLIARGKRGWTVFVYVFGPWDHEPSERDLAALGPGDSLMQFVMEDTRLRRGELPIIWHDPDFAREHWPMPELGMYPGGNETAWAIRMSEDNPFESISKRDEPSRV